jgi:hypothetical protein
MLSICTWQSYSSTCSHGFWRTTSHHHELCRVWMGARKFSLRLTSWSYIIWRLLRFTALRVSLETNCCSTNQRGIMFVWFPSPVNQTQKAVPKDSGYWNWSYKPKSPISVSWEIGSSP